MRSPTVARTGLLSPTLPRGLLPGRLPQRAHSTPTGDQGTPAIYALVPRLPPATESHPRRSRSKRVDVSRVLHTIFLLLPTTLVSLDHFGFHLPAARNRR
jgi:hypothetical protein